MKIELTDQQEEAVAQGRPVEIADPTSRRSIVVVAREVFERVRFLIEGTTVQTTTAVEFATEGNPLRQRICDLPLPPQIAVEANRYCVRLGLWGVKNRSQTEEQMKLQHFYGGKWIAYLRTNEGPVVVAAADSLADPAFDQQLSFLTPEERRSVLVDSPIRLFDDESQILSATSHES